MNNLYLDRKDIGNIKKDIGYTFIKNLKPSTCIVKLMEKDGEQVVLKRAEYDETIKDWMKENILEEHRRLDAVKGYDKISQMKNFYDFSEIAKPSGKIYGDALIYPYLLEKEFVEGENIDMFYLSKKDKKEITDIVNYFHSKGISNLDIEERNFIRNSDRGIVMIDAGGSSDLFHKSFGENKEKDLNDLEFLLEGSSKKYCSSGPLY